jgi:hypothetical protein
MRFRADWQGRYKASVRVNIMAVSSWPNAVRMALLRSPILVQIEILFGNSAASGTALGTRAGWIMENPYVLQRLTVIQTILNGVHQAGASMSAATRPLPLNRDGNSGEWL